MRKLEGLDIHPALKEQLQRRQDRLARIRESRQTQRVRVVPANEEIRKIRFPGRNRFPAQGSAEWPLDQFTKRRIREGSVMIEERREETRRAARPPRSA
jgi:hypothetical protein